MQTALQPLLFAPIADDLFKLARYESILDRQIHQALAEFRRRGK